MWSPLIPQLHWTYLCPGKAGVLTACIFFICSHFQMTFKMIFKKIRGSSSWYDDSSFMSYQIWTGGFAILQLSSVSPSYHRCKGS